MMFRKSCTNCEREATVELGGRPYCSEHAFTKIQATKGPCEQPRRLRGTLKIRG